MRQFRAPLFTSILVLTQILSPISYGATAVNVSQLKHDIKDDVKDLKRILDAERFYYYTTRQMERLHGKVDQSILAGLKNIAQLDSILVEFKGQELGDPNKYDSLILKALQARGLNVEMADIKWDYPFFKRKLGEGFLLQVSKDKPLKTEIVIPRERQNVSIPKIDLDLTLDGQMYTSDRTTQAVFEFAENRILEFHIGPQIRFFEEVKRQNGEIIGEISPMASNYNKAYIYRLPGSSEIRIALTELYGQDRIDHLLKSAALVLKKRAPKQIQIVGNVEKAQEQLAEQIKMVFRQAPHADNIVVGQKGAFANAVSHAYKVESIARAVQAKPDLVAQLIGALDFKKINKILIEKSSRGTHFVSLDEGSLVDKAFEALKEELPKLGVSVTTRTYDFDFEMGPFVIQDSILRSSDGKEQRWRFISNVWGDELKPMMRALGETGHKELTYIGTAGAFQASGLKVGDVFAPSVAVSLAGNTYSFNTTGFKPSGIQMGGVVTTVSSIFDESHAWLSEHDGKYQAVEVETAHLAEQAKMYGMKTDVFLLISDVVGTEETLAQSSSTKRKKSQLRLISDLFAEKGVLGTKVDTTLKVSPLTAVKTVNERAAEILKDKDPVFKMYMEKMIERSAIKSVAELEKFVEETKTFTTDYMQKKLLELGTPVTKLLSRLSQEGISHSWATDLRLDDGIWNPKSESLKIFVAVESLEDLEKAKAYLAALSEDLNIKKALLQIEITKGPPNGLKKSDMVPYIEGQGSEILMNRFADVALVKGGLILRENASGSISFAPYTKADPATKAAQLAFFAASPETLSILDLLNNGRKPEEVLMREIKSMNFFARENQKNWDIKIQEVASLPEGELARLIPVINEDSLTIKLEITPEGLRNGAVVLEEIMHLQQITNIKLKWSEKSRSMESFVHPYHWAEVIENAREGSWEALAKLDKEEIQAIKASQIAVQSYQKLFSKGALNPVLVEYFALRTAHAEARYKASQVNARREKSKGQRLLDQQRKLWDALEAKAEKLNDLIAKNDRKGVRELIEAYLPWSQMLPAEKAAWIQWLNAMEKPNKQNRELVFRGMYDDQISTNKEGKIYLMSTLLTRNQGSYTRRLRSLTTVRERFATEAYRHEKTLAEFEVQAKDPASVSVLMYNHSVKAQGSPFLSMANLDVAMKFGPRKLGAFLIDRDRMMLNALPESKYAFQQERLVPLIVFPDEVVLYHDYVKESEGISVVRPEERKANFIKKVEKVLGRAVTVQEVKGGSIDSFIRDGFRQWKKNLGIGQNDNLQKVSAQQTLAAPRSEKLDSQGAVGVGARCEGLFLK